MIKKSLFTLFSVALLLWLTSCETDVDIDTDWKEITVVYGLLNQLDTAHYLRINKAFLGGNVLEIQKIEDSSSYLNNLEVTIEGWSAAGPQSKITFDTVSIANKEPGDWYNPYMLVYKGVGGLDPTLQYRLTVKNKTTGHQVTSATNLIKSFFIEKPFSGGKLTLFRGFNTSFVWQNGLNAKRYEPVIRFHYYEKAAGTGDYQSKYVDWTLSTITSPGNDGSGKSETGFANDAFYEFVNHSFKDDGFVGQRMCGKVDFIVSAGGIEFDTYMRVNGPSFSLVQDKPEYTNIENGLGLFSSRYLVQLQKTLDPRAEAIILEYGNGFIKNPDL
jgi:hypothetical protein